MHPIELLGFVVASLVALCCLEKGVETNHYFGWVKYDALWIGASILIVSCELIYMVVRSH